MGALLLPMVPFILAAAVSVLAFLVLAGVYRLQAERRDEVARASVVSHLGAIRGRLDAALTEPLLIARGLRAHIIEHGGMADEEFSRLAAILLADYPTIRNLTLSRGTVISVVYPLEGNRAVVGVDYRSRPDQWTTVERAVSTRRPVLAGPVRLIQGGTALIGRVPIFLADADGGTGRLFGLISVVIDMPKVFAAAGIEREALPIDLAIRGLEGQGAAGGMIWGDESLFKGQVVAMDMALPGGTWNLAGRPRPDWGADGGELALTRMLGGALALLVAFASFGGAFYVRSLRRARFAMAESEERYRALVETAPVAVCVHRGGRVILANGEAVRMAGAGSVEDFIGRDVFQMVHPDYRELAAGRVARVMGGDGAVPLEAQRFCTFDGRVVDVEVASSRVLIGGESAVLSVISDVTERHRAEAERERLLQNLRRSNEDLLQFAHIASHDLQEPLRNVAGYVQLLSRRYRGRLDLDADQFIDFAVNGVKRMQKMISDLLDYCRLGDEEDAGGGADAAQVLSDVLEDMKFELAEVGAVVEQGDLPRVPMPPHELARVLGILIGNALKYRKPDLAPVIRVGAAREGREWVISVADNGIGIAEEYRERIFSVFQRLHPRDTYEGTGIGLAICRKLIQNRGGRLWVEARSGSGSDFRFALPEGPLVGARPSRPHAGDGFKGSQLASE